MNVGVIGSGTAGRALATAFLSEGHSVMLGTRDTFKEEVQKWRKENADGKAGTFEDTAAFGELLVLVTRGDIASKALEMAGAMNLSGKVIIDATNPIAKEPPVNGVLVYFSSINHSLMEDLQATFGEAKFVKAFNSVGNNLMYKPQMKGGKPSMFICGNDEGAKKKVTDILTSFGWETEDMGKAEAARAIEPLCMLWCIPGMLHNQWSHAFKLLRV